MNFCAYWKQFWGNACTKFMSLRWNFNPKMLLHISKNRLLLRSGSLRLLKFWKQIHMNRHISESRDVTFGRRNAQPCLKSFFFVWKWQKISNQPVIHWVFCACFLRTMFAILGTEVERGTLMSSLGINREWCCVLWSLLRKTWL